MARGDPMNMTIINSFTSFFSPLSFSFSFSFSTCQFFSSMFKYSLLVTCVSLGLISFEHSTTHEKTSPSRLFSYLRMNSSRFLPFSFFNRRRCAAYSSTRNDKRWIDPDVCSFMRLRSNIRWLLLSSRRRRRWRLEISKRAIIKRNPFSHRLISNISYYRFHLLLHMCNFVHEQTRRNRLIIRSFKTTTARARKEWQLDKTLSLLSLASHNDRPLSSVNDFSAISRYICLRFLFTSQGHSHLFDLISEERSWLDINFDSFDWYDLLSFREFHVCKLTITTTPGTRWQAMICSTARDTFRSIWFEMMSGANLLEHWHNQRDEAKSRHIAIFLARWKGTCVWKRDSSMCTAGSSHLTLTL